jgi:predicted nucleotidyltransferase
MRTRRSGESALLLLDAVEVLLDEQVDYAVVGAMAASVHGVVRASLDADAVLSITTHELGKLQQRFAAAGFTAELRRGDLEDPIAAVLALADGFGNRVDLLVGLRGLEAEAFRRAIDIAFQGTLLRVIGIEDFIAMKLFAGGPQDLADARYALAAAKSSIDDQLLLHLATRYGSQAVSELKKLAPSPS